MKSLNLVGAVLMFISFVAVIFVGFQVVNSSVAYSREVGGNWELGVKAATIEQKSEYIDKYVAALEDARLEGQHDAWWYPTPNNSFDENFKALKSLQARLKAIEGMDENSFEYQTAIQQITQQEQDEASAMTGVLRGVWFKENYGFIYYGGFLWVLLVGFVLFFVGLSLALWEE